MNAIATPLRLGGATAVNRVFLAPMAGITDRPFRRQALALGAGLVVSEMVAGERLLHGAVDALSKIAATGSGPHVVQLAGCEAGWMAEAARAAADAGADVIDINMGCPSKRVVGGWSGAALMREPDHALRLVEAVVGAVTVPVTVKMRLGWDDASRNAPALAARAEAAGVQMVTVHGRTRAQFYKGRADWAAIAAVKRAVSIPVVANGDLVDPADAPAMLAASGADALMIGRGAQGRPWLPGDVAHYLSTGERRPEPGAAERRALLGAQVEEMLGLYGRELGLRCARKHIGWSLDAWPVADGAGLRRAIVTSEDVGMVHRLLDSWFAGGEPARMAA